MIAFSRFNPVIAGGLWLGCLLWPMPPAADAAEDPQLQRGAAIYTESCAECHGAAGQGVEGAYEDPLVGDYSIGELAQQISRTMPEGDPEACVGADAEAVAAYIHHAFYSEAAQVRNRPPRISLARLTAAQMRQSLADLYEQFELRQSDLPAGGLRGVYFAGSRWRDENKKFERLDPHLHFDFGHAGPGGEISPEEFYIRWEGGLHVPASGRYEIVVRSTCSFKMDFGRIGRQLIDNHTQSGDKTEFREVLQLTAGRIYPLRIDFVQRKRKTEQPPAKISLAWVPPGGVERVIAAEHLVSKLPAPSFALQTPLPADDRSYGFERGVAINRQWDDSTTAAALEFGSIAAAELWPEYLRRQRGKPADKQEVMRGFLTQIVQTAFRQPLSEELLESYIVRQLEAEPDDAQAIQRSLLISLKSPRFLYPLADSDQPRSQQVANRVALILFDSLPSDPKLLQAVAQGNFHTPEQVRVYVREQLDDPRLRAKLRGMLHEWLNLGQLSDISKSGEHYPGFDPQLVDDLKRSLDALLEEIAWGPSGDFRQFFLSQEAFTTPRIAEFYGSDWQAESDTPAAAESALLDGQLTRANPNPQQPRWGVLTHPYLLSGLAYHDASSPIHRGVFLLRYLLGRTLRPPAEAFSPLSPDLHPELTTRQRVALQTSPESCQVCHHKINGLGFTLENFDAVGRYRQTERAATIDASGSYTTRDDRLVEFATAEDVARFLAESPDAKRALVNRAFQYFVKQPPAAFGETTVDALCEKFADKQCNIRELIVEIAVLAACHPIESSEHDLARNR